MPEDYCPPHCKNSRSAFMGCICMTCTIGGGYSIHLLLSETHFLLQNCFHAFMRSKKKKIHILLFLTRLQYLSVFWHWMKNILQQSSLAIWIHLYPRLMIWLAVLWCWSLLRMTVKPLEYILFIKSTCVANIIHRDAATPSEQIYKLFNRHGLNI